MKEYLLNEIAIRVRRLSTERWGAQKAINLVGRHSVILAAQERLTCFTQLEEPVLITGESGVGKEVFARSHYLLGKRHGQPFSCVNCAQYQDHHLIVSELFGHRKGSFTGAAADRAGIFKDCDGGVVFLDEIGELAPQVQAMFLRVLAEGEIRPLGSDRSESVNVQIITATSRDLKQMVKEGTFREDLYYRLRHFHLHIPPLRDRGDDWRIMINYYLKLLNTAQQTNKKIADSAYKVLANYSFPGNIRELRSIIYTGYALSGQRSLIQPEDFVSLLRESETKKRITENDVSSHYDSIVALGGSFWEVIQKPYLDRELNRREVKRLIAQGLRESNGNYKRLISLFGMDDNQYLKFMDFLRHHRLKP